MLRTLLFAMLLGLVMVTGYQCHGEPKPKAVESYRPVTIGGMKVAVPANWEEMNLDSEQFAEIKKDMDESEGANAVNFYEEETHSAVLVFMVEDMRLLFEREGELWEGWEQFTEETLSGKEDIAFSIASAFLKTHYRIEKEFAYELDVDGLEAWEMLFDAGDYRYRTLTVFGEDKLALVLLMVKERYWYVFWDCWLPIKDSVILE